MAQFQMVCGFCISATTGSEYRLMKGYTSAYKRMRWDMPSPTLTRNLSYACSDKKLHPVQNRVLSLHEAMILHTVIEYDFHWKRKDGKKVSDKLIRELIGESIPPSGLEKIFLHLKSITDGNTVYEAIKTFDVTNSVESVE